MERNSSDDLNSSPGSMGSGTASTSAGDGSMAGSNGGSFDAAMDKGTMGASGGASSYGSGSAAGYGPSSAGYGSSGGSGSVGGEYGTSSTGADSAGRLDALKGRAGELKATLADKLEAGADKLRQRGQGGAAYASGVGSVVATDERLASAGDSLARGLQGTADFLRDGDLKATVEEQIKNHPGRTLLIAVGLGYLLGKALRR